MKNKSKIVSIAPNLVQGEPQDNLVSLFESVLSEISDDPRREGILKTPARVAKSLRFLTAGYRQDPKKVINGALFAEDNDEMVTMKDIALYSLCEHHLLPFFGKCHVAYIPKNRIIGISKIARLVDVFARRLQVQERLTKQIAETLQETLDPRGVAVVIEAEHLCMQMRGVQKQGSRVLTSAMLGAFRTRQETREEFMNLIRG